jgi:hypothetical protein
MQHLSKTLRYYEHVEEVFTALHTFFYRRDVSIRILKFGADETYAFCLIRCHDANTIISCNSHTFPCAALILSFKPSYCGGLIWSTACVLRTVSRGWSAVGTVWSASVACFLCSEGCWKSAWSSAFEVEQHRRGLTPHCVEENTRSSKQSKQRREETLKKPRTLTSLQFGGYRGRQAQISSWSWFIDLLTM